MLRHCLHLEVNLSGAAEIPLNTILQSFITFDGSYEHLVIQTVRLPRSLVALLVGSSLAVAGALMQGLTRNPLADPGIIGINAGASLAAVVVIVLLPSAPIYILPLSAFVGALLIAGLIYSLAWNNGSSPVLFILMGVGLSAIASAFTSLLITFDDIYSVSDALVCLAGSVYGRTWEGVEVILETTQGDKLQITKHLYEIFPNPFSLTGEILPGWNVFASYAYNDARVTQDNSIPVGNRVQRTTPHAASLWTTYQIQRGNLQGLGFGLGLFYVGDRAGDTGNTFEVRSYTFKILPELKKH